MVCVEDFREISAYLPLIFRLSSAYLPNGLGEMKLCMVVAASLRGVDRRVKIALKKELKDALLDDTKEFVAPEPLPTL